MSDCKEYHPLLSGMLDGELTAEEAATISKHLNRCAACRNEYEALREESSRLDALSIREPQEHALEKFWRLPFSHAARNAGLILIVGGYLLLLFYGFFEFMVDDGEGLVSKLGIAGMLIGGLIIFGIALIERMITYQSDPYKEIER